MFTPLYIIKFIYNDSTNFIYIKDESFNETGSIKIRPAKYIFKKAYETGLIDKNTEVFDVTSGNMGIALAYAAKEYGNKVTIFMPNFVSEERKDMIKKLGAKLVLTDNFEEAFDLAKKKKDGFYVKQFENRFNSESYSSLFDELTSKITNIPAFVAGVGTGGTIAGVGSLAESKFNSKIIALEPKESLILSTGINHGEHEIQGLSDGFIPELYNDIKVDQIISISSLDSIVMAQKLNKELNLHVGISSGTNFLGAVLSNINGAVTVFPDSNDRYKSTRLSDLSLKSDLVDKIKLLEIIKL